MRLLLINGNTTQFVTDAAAREARLAAADGTEVVARLGTDASGHSGPEAGDKVFVDFAPGSVQVLEA